MIRERMRAGEQLTCGLVRMPCEEVVEMLAVAGVDVVLIDCEHGPADIGMLRHHLSLADAHGVLVLVRIGEGEHRLAQRALDQGAHGIVAPHIESAAEATALVRAVRYPPHGDRGFATYPRAGRFGTRTADEHRAAADAATFVLVMLESPGAIVRAGEIVAVDGVDGWLVGTGDLAVARDPSDPSVAELLARIRSDPAVAGAIRADLASSAEAGAAAVADDAQLVVYNVAEVMMTAFTRLARP